MNPKQGMGKKPNDANMSKWSIPTPDGYKPENAPAKPQGGTRAPAGVANKHATTMGHSATSSNAASVVSSIKSRY